MSPPSFEPADLLDLKLVPAWVKEPGGIESYAHYKGDEEVERPRGRDDRGPGRDRRPKRHAGRPPDKGQERRGPRRDGVGKPQRPHRPEAEQRVPEAPLEIGVRFLPGPVVLESVVAQIQSDALAYSLFHLARLFLEKPQRYGVHLKPKTPDTLYQLGEDGGISANRSLLETNAFRLVSEKFYKVEVTQSEPIKGNFLSIARCRLSGTALGPTSHHAYQPRLRSLYEQRFSRRMSFAEYQRQIEIVSDPAVVERWKEEARNVTTYSTLLDETPIAFTSVADAERHFRQNYLPALIHSVEEALIDGLSSRQLQDRQLNRHIEDAWSAENRSPSNMMQELAKNFREAGLQIFRHRRGMLFVSSIRARSFLHDQTGVSAQVKGILEALAATPGIHRKDLADRLLKAQEGEDPETRKLALASDLRWLISEGYVIEFNDGSLELPREKNKTSVASGPDVTARNEDSEAGTDAASAVMPETTSSAEEQAPPTKTVLNKVAAIDPNRQTAGTE